MTHVEIFLGGATGEMSIASRSAAGTIRIYDTYKFISKKYYNIKWHYRSLDSWLSGFPKLECDFHTWLKFTRNTLIHQANNKKYDCKLRELKIKKRKAKEE